MTPQVNRLVPLYRISDTGMASNLISKVISYTLVTLRTMSSKDLVGSSTQMVARIRDTLKEESVMATDHLPFQTLNKATRAGGPTTSMRVLGTTSLS